jgi:uncharacterized protein YjbI with pentapeptide repeats
MANQEHLDILRQGVTVWNQWREKYPNIQPDLKRANLAGMNLHKANFSDTYFSKADLSQAQLAEANLMGADLAHVDLRKATLRYANLTWARLSEANLAEVDLTGANLSWASLKLADLSSGRLIGANLNGTNLSGVNLSEANLNNAILVRTNLQGANLTACSIYGVSAWDVQLEGVKQSNLLITLPGTPAITVDDLEVAQFIYLILNNKKIRDVIDTITSKVVLILGRFTPERKIILDAIREELRKRNYTPVLFDFEKPTNRDVTETVSTLAHMARFVIADITDAKSIPQELSHIIPFLPSVPIAPLLQASEREYGMYEHFISYPWVQPIYHYRDLDELLHSMQEHIIEPAEKKVRELAIEKAKRLERP